ncbi:MAG: archease [Deltaproteobacteria bacterium]|nr:archease [Deltaproteobacteria bacterium]
MVLNWWHSPEIISKLQIIIAVLIICLTGFGLLLKVQGDRLKKQIEKEKTTELQNELTMTKNKLNNSDQTIKQLTIVTEQAKGQINNLADDSIKAHKTIEALNIKAKKAERGISSTYDFQGIKRDISPGVIKANMGEETEVFKKLVNLEKEKKYPDLASLCKSQIVKTPDWLTPYLFLGVAQANMGLKTEALSNFEHVIKNAPGAMSNYKFFDHTADIGVEVTGRTRRELFVTAAGALFDVMIESKTGEASEKQHKTITIEGADAADLLINFLRELLYLFNGEKFIIVRCEMIKFTNKELQARLTGESFNNKKHLIKTEIKAVTYSGAQVEKLEDHWTARVIFDV